MAHSSKSLQCYAHGRDGAWEAICVDLDLAVAGDTFEEVQNSLEIAIAEYLELVSQEAPEQQKKLLNRRAPWFVRLSLAGKMLAFMIFGGRSREAQASFPMPCPA